MRVVFGPGTRRAAGHSRRKWQAYHFVKYVDLESNSRATPTEELVWPAPGKYPDELGDELVMDVAAGDHAAHLHPRHRAA